MVNIFSKIFLIPGIPKDFLRKALTKCGGHVRLTERGDPPSPRVETLSVEEMRGVSCGSKQGDTKPKNSLKNSLLQDLPAHHAAH
jgi:hypothetical protein